MIRYFEVPGASADQIRLGDQYEDRQVRLASIFRRRCSCAPTMWSNEFFCRSALGPEVAHRVGSLRRTDSVAIEGIADIRRSLAARRSDVNDPQPVIGPTDRLQNAHDTR